MRYVFLILICAIWFMVGYVKGKEIYNVDLSKIFEINNQYNKALEEFNEQLMEDIFNLHQVNQNLMAEIKLLEKALGENKEAETSNPIS